MAATRGGLAATGSQRAALPCLLALLCLHAGRASPAYTYDHSSTQKFAAPLSEEPSAPTVEQTHIALTANAGEMLATFVVLDADAAEAAAADAEVRWGTVAGSPTQSAPATNHTYAAGGFQGVIFEAVMSGLQDGATYYYSTHAANSSSREFRFRYRPGAESIRFLSYGDMGIKNSWGTYTMCNQDAESGSYDFTMNVGDTSYADDYNRGDPVKPNSFVFDRHFRNIEPHAAQMPFMTVPGNHEHQYDFAAYLNRMRMPAPRFAWANATLSRFYYSFDYGPAHFLVYSSEHPFPRGSEQWHFIKADLEAASAPAAREARPWLVVWTHRPLYCSDLVTWETRCTKEAETYRASIEELLLRARVDLHVCGHNHQYERSHPVRDCGHKYETGCNITQSLHNAASPVYVVNGAAGEVEGSDPTWQRFGAAPFRAAHDRGLHTGYARVSVNRTALEWQFVYSGGNAVLGKNSSNLDGAGTVQDAFTITKGPGWWAM